MWKFIGRSLGKVGKSGGAGQTVLMEHSDLVPACRVGEVLNNGPMVSASSFFLERVDLTPDPSALALKLDNSVPPRMSLVFFKMQSLWWSSECMSL